MNSKLLLASVLLMGLAISCSQDSPPAASSDGVLSGAPASAAKASAPASPAFVSAASASDAPPKDARYTIYCLGVEGPDHTARANQIKLLWQQATARRDWYVVHQDDQSLVYFGYYRSIADPNDRDTARAAADLKIIKSLKDTIGDQPFEAAILMPLDAPDPTAPPDFNLLNAKGVWTLEIAAYKGPGRKQAAVDSVKAARAQGIEAYYYHGPSASSVCIGTWPQDAVSVEVKGDLQNPDPSGSVMVVPDSLAAQVPDNMTDAQGNRTKVVHRGAQIADPTLAAAMARYPTHSVNGIDDTIMVNGKPEPRQSAVVAIPHATDASADAPAPPQRPTVDLLGGGQTGGDSSGGGSSGGRLRSMGQ